MVGAIATATEIQNDFGRYLDMVMNGNEVIITKNGKEVGRLIPKDRTVSYLTDSLTGILTGGHDLKYEREEWLREKYEIVDRC